MVVGRGAKAAALVGTGAVAAAMVCALAACGASPVPFSPATTARTLPGSSGREASPLFTTTTPDVRLNLTSHRPGDCLTWDQSPGSLQSAVPVPCAKAHLIEVTGEANVPGGLSAPYPTRDQWVSLQEQLCAPLVAPYLGYPLDPAGRFFAGALHPTPEGWKQFDRTVWCGISARWPSFQTPVADANYPFSGVVKGQDQTYLVAPGTCLALTLDGHLGDAVPCSQPHGVEATGTFTVTVTNFPTSVQAWDAAIGSGCVGPTTRYAGGRLPPGASASFLQFASTSWAAGRRVVVCIAARFDQSGNLAATTGSVRVGA